MRALWRRFKNGYLNLRLQTKFTIALISIVVLPAFLTVFLFYGKLYNMVVSNTIRQEQDASAKTAPLIERTMDTILATTRNITGQTFFQELFYMPVSDSAKELASSNHAIFRKNWKHWMMIQIQKIFWLLSARPKELTGTESFRVTGKTRKCSVLLFTLVPRKKRITEIWRISVL